MIYLSLNGIPIDSGKNHYWTSHAWLFPPKSESSIRYIYADHCREVLGLAAPLSQVRFRMNHLGYSLPETQDRFEALVDRWNQTYKLQLTFDQFLTAVTSIDFGTITASDQKDFEYDFNNLILKLLVPYDTEDSFLEEFIKERTDSHLLLRCLAEREDSWEFLLSWGYQDLIESGWETISTLMQLDRASYILNHIKLYGRLQDYSGKHRIADFDRWLEAHGLSKSTPYIQSGPAGPQPSRNDTLPTVVRNMIHHPENRNQVLDDTLLQGGLEQLLQVARTLDPPLYI